MAQTGPQHAELPKLPRASFIKPRSHTVLMIVVPLLSIFFAFLLIVQQRHITELEQRVHNLTQELREEQTHSAFYKRAYELTLDDIKLLSASYGGQGRYEQLAQELREQELGAVLGNTTAHERHVLRNPWLWAQYEEQGIVNSSCLALPFAVDTISDEVLVSFSVQAANATVSLYVDGNMLERVAVLGAATHATQVLLSPGVHEIDIVSDAQVRLAGMNIDTVALPLGNVTADTGMVWSVFDCAGANRAYSLPGPGALRIRIAKR